MRDYLRRKDVPKEYPISFSSLAHMASQGYGPRYRLVGKSAIYRRDEVEDWLEEQVVELVPRSNTRRRGRPRKFDTIHNSRDLKVSEAPNE